MPCTQNYGCCLEARQAENPTVNNDVLPSKILEIRMQPCPMVGNHFPLWETPSHGGKQFPTAFCTEGSPAHRCIGEAAPQKEATGQPYSANTPWMIFVRWQCLANDSPAMGLGKATPVYWYVHTHTNLPTGLKPEHLPTSGSSLVLPALTFNV